MADSDLNASEAATDLRRFAVVAISAEYPIDEDTRALRTVERVDIFPNDIPAWGHFENSAPLALADKRVPRVQALRAADMRAEEGPTRISLVAPDFFAGLRIEFDDAREWGDSDILTIREEQDVPVGQHLAIMLLSPTIIALFPARPTAGAVDDHERRELAKADHDVAIRERTACIGMRKLFPVADWI